MIKFTKEQQPHERMRMLRAWRNITQKEMAGFLGTSQRRYCDWETGKRIPSTKFKERIQAFWKASGKVWE